MPTVQFTHPDGRVETIAAKVGESVMDTAVMNGVDGIVADCGGALSCASCHVYVNEAFAGSVGPIDPYENDMLEGTASERRESSRLSCQIIITDDLDGLAVEIPEAQL